MSFQKKQSKKKKKILIVEDDELFSQILQKRLELQDYEVVTVPNGRSAISNIGMSKFEAVVIDIRLPDMNGIQLLHKLKSMRPVPIILMSSTREFKSAEEAEEVGALCFILKPFKGDELTKILAETLSEYRKEKSAEPSGEFPGESEEKLDAKSIDEILETLEEPKNQTDTQIEAYCKIPISDFISGKELLYDIYIRLSDEKYLKIANRNSSFSVDRIKSYASKGVTHLYLRLKDFRRYVKNSVKLADSVQTSPNISKQKKLKFLANVNSVIMTQMHLEGIHEDSFSHSVSVMKATLSLLSESGDLISILEALSHHSNSLFAHGIGVGLYSTMIARELGQYSPMDMVYFSMGGLLHDMGKKDMPQELLAKPEPFLTHREKNLLRQHPLIGAEILSKFPVVPSEVVKIAAQHHENCLGTGYPKRLPANAIFPMANVVSTANQFCNLVIQDLGNPVPISPEKAIRKMALTQEILDPDSFEKLAKLFGVPLNQTSSGNPD